VSVTVIAAGEHKAEGNPYEPLPEDVRESIQAEMESLRSIFAETVGAGRGDALTAKAALATEAACFLGAAAVENGLADEVADPREAFAEFISEINGRGPSTPSTSTATQETLEMPTENTGTNIPLGQDSNSEPTGSENTQTSPPEGEQPSPPSADTAATERNRIAGILGCEEAEGRRELAESLAFNSSMSVDEAKKHLAAAPKAQPSQSLSQEMGNGEDTDLEGHEPNASEENPVIAAQKKRHSQA
jgi:ClpP class serine protease